MDNLIISSVGSDHRVQYSYEIPHEYLSGWENLSEKIISAKRKHLLPCLIYSDFFLRQLYLLRSYFFTFLQSNFFDTAVTFSEQLFLQSDYFFWGARFPEQSLLCGIYFFRNSYFFRVKLLPSSQFLKTGSSLGQLLCRNSYFFDEGTYSE